MSDEHWLTNVFRRAEQEYDALPAWARPVLTRPLAIPPLFGPPLLGGDGPPAQPPAQAADHGATSPASGSSR